MRSTSLTLFSFIYLYGASMIDAAPDPPDGAIIAVYFGALKYGCVAAQFLGGNDLCDAVAENLTDCKETAYADVLDSCRDLDEQWIELAGGCQEGELTDCECYQKALDIIATAEAQTVVPFISQFASCLDSIGTCPFSILDVFGAFIPGLPFPADITYASCEEEYELLQSLNLTDSCTNLACPTPLSTPKPTPKPTPLPTTAKPTPLPTIKPTPLPTTGSSSRACISGDMTVMSEDGARKSVLNLKIGDLVHVGQGNYEPIIWQTEHRDMNNLKGNAMIKALYLDIVLSTNHKISVTPNHYVVTAEGERLAKDLKVNDALLVVSDGSFAKIVSIDPKFKSGVYNPQTPSQKIVINGVLVSTRTQNSPPFWFMSVSFMALHLLYCLFPKSIYIRFIAFLAECVYEPIYYGAIQWHHLVAASFIVFIAFKK